MTRLERLWGDGDCRCGRQRLGFGCGFPSASDNDVHGVRDGNVRLAGEASMDSDSTEDVGSGGLAKRGLLHDQLNSHAGVLQTAIVETESAGVAVDGVRSALDVEDAREAFGRAPVDEALFDFLAVRVVADFALACVALEIGTILGAGDGRIGGAGIGIHGAERTRIFGMGV